MHTGYRPPLALLATLAMLGATPAGAAEDRPWYIGASQTFTRDDNVFRNVGNKTADTISSTAVLGGLDFRPGRQRLYLDATAASNKFDKLDQLDNTSHSVSTGLNWETVGDLSGSLRYHRRQSLTDYSVIGTPDVKDVEKAQTASAGIRWGSARALGVEGTVERRKLDLSLSDERDTTQDVVSLGLRWRGGGELSFGVAGRWTEAETPLYQPLLPVELWIAGLPQLGPIEPDETERRDLDFTVSWVPSGLSTITGRISLTKEDHTAPSRPDFDGVTGAVMWEYKPTGKTVIRSSLIRDTSDHASFLSLQQIGLTGLRFENSRISWIGVVEADWAATAKIMVNGSVRHGRSEFETLDGPGFNSSTTKLRLAAHYQATRAIALGCSLSHERGSSTSDFRANITSCYGQFVLQ
jgi:hypothetical protein